MALEVSTTASRPTSGYTSIPGVKSIPEFGTDINTLETTTTDETVCKTYIAGLNDPGGALGLTVNDYAAFRSEWNSMYSAWNASKSTHVVWVEYTAPAGSGMDSFYYPAQPTPLGFGGAEPDEVFSNTASFIPVGAFAFASAST